MKKIRSWNTTSTIGVMSMSASVNLREAFFLTPGVASSNTAAGGGGSGGGAGSPGTFHRGGGTGAGMEVWLAVGDGVTGGVGGAGLARKTWLHCGQRIFLPRACSLAGTSAPQAGQWTGMLRAVIASLAR